MIYTKKYLLIAGLCWINGVFSIIPEECEKMPPFFEQQIDEYQKLEDEKAGLGWFAFVTQRCRVNEIENQQLDIRSRLQHELRAGCFVCSNEILAKMVASYAKIDDKNKKVNR